MQKQSPFRKGKQTSEQNIYQQSEKKETYNQLFENYKNQMKSNLDIQKTQMHSSEAQNQSPSKIKDLQKLSQNSKQVAKQSHDFAVKNILHRNQVLNDFIQMSSPIKKDLDQISPQKQENDGKVQGSKFQISLNQSQIPSQIKEHKNDIQKNNQQTVQNQQINSKAKNEYLGKYFHKKSSSVFQEISGSSAILKNKSNDYGILNGKLNNKNQNVVENLQKSTFLAVPQQQQIQKSSSQVLLQKPKNNETKISSTNKDKIKDNNNYNNFLNSNLQVPNKKNLIENEKSVIGKQSSLSKNQPNDYLQSPIKNKSNLKLENQKIRPSSSIAGASKFQKQQSEAKQNPQQSKLIVKSQSSQQIQNFSAVNLLKNNKNLQEQTSSKVDIVKGNQVHKTQSNLNLQTQIPQIQKMQSPSKNAKKLNSIQSRNEYPDYQIKVQSKQYSSPKANQLSIQKSVSLTKLQSKQKAEISQNDLKSPQKKTLIPESVSKSQLSNLDLRQSSFGQRASKLSKAETQVISNNLRASIIKPLESQKKESNSFKQFYQEVENILKFNGYEEEMITNTDFAKILIDLGFVHAAKLKLSYHIEFALSLPMVDLLWTILVKIVPISKKQPDKAYKNDLFILLAAILNLPSDQLIDSSNTKSRTVNPLLFRNKQGEIVFSSFDDLQKFTIKFISLKIGYNKNEEMRNENLAQIQELFMEKQAAQKAEKIDNFKKRVTSAKPEISTFKSPSKKMSIIEKPEQPKFEPQYTKELPKQRIQNDIIQIQMPAQKKISVTNSEHKEKIGSLQKLDALQKQKEDLMKANQEQFKSPIKSKADVFKTSFSNQYLKKMQKQNQEPQNPEIEYQFQLEEKIEIQKIEVKKQNSTNLQTKKQISELKLNNQKPLTRSEDSIKKILGLVYKKSLESYEDKASLLEKNSSFEHLSANLNFRQTIKNNSFAALNDFKEYEKEVKKLTALINSNQIQGYTQGQQIFDQKKIVKIKEKDEDVNLNYFLQIKEEPKKAENLKQSQNPKPAQNIQNPKPVQNVLNEKSLHNVQNEKSLHNVLASQIQKAYVNPYLKSKQKGPEMQGQGNQMSSSRPQNNFKQIFKETQPNATNQSSFDKHDIQVKQENEFFTRQLRRNNYLIQYEESEESVSEISDSVKSKKSKKRGQLMVINVDLGNKGYQVLQCMDSEDPQKVAEKFAKTHSLSGSTQQQVLNLIVNKIAQMNQYKGLSYY